MGPVQGTHLADIDPGDLLESAVPGAFAFVNGDSRLAYICPCGCGDMNQIPLGAGRGWRWDGNRAAPTLTQSIRRIGGCCYHGYLTAGIWTFESDSGAGRAPAV